MIDEQARQMLGSFLRTRRESLRPEQVGLAGGGRRRTPGLRREEVAQLAGVSITWYTWIEQGRPISFTAEVLASLARVLRLRAQETDYLFALAHLPTPASRATSDEVAPALLRLLEHQRGYPAYVMGRSWDLLAWNRAAGGLFGDFGTLPPQQRNLLWYTFTSAYARRLIVDWEQRAQRLIAEFRLDCGELLAEPWMRTFIERLSLASPEFRRWWPQQQVHARDGGRRRFAHPHCGLLVFEQLTLHPAGSPGHKLVVHIPAEDSETLANLDLLATAPPEIGLEM